MFMLARTEKGVKKQDGISFLLVDMKSPGITVRPIRNIGGSTTFAEVFFDDVRTPADWLVGERNQGWSIAKSLLGFERLSIGSPRLAQAGLKRLDDVLAERGGAISAQYADRVARLRLDVADLASLYEKFAAAVRRGERLGADVSVLKVFATDLFQRLSELSIEVAGSAGGITGRTQFREEGSRVDVLSLFYNARPPTIYGGSNEIQRNIIAKSLLNLPMG
ncbi:putative acyl-CoA dehydrogenase [Variovorax sp. WDL1]|nr:putative acyl-CoA dehydrogenase [Variovorax sp. WDL1]